MQIEPPNYISETVLRQSPNDTRVYKAVELQNKLKVVMISDPTVEKSACAISVGVGSLCDPDRSLGLAHFLEHMLFMGSENYPEHNEYASFISNHGGSDNAYTDMEETNYYFQIANQYFSEGVKRLADFFRKPILNPECVEKERQAVHEEYKLWTSEDNTRKWQIIHELAEGPYSRFSIGNQQTLNHKDILEDLRGYYDKAYSSNIINAVLVSNLSISDQEKLLQPLGQIKNKDYVKQDFGIPFPPARLGKMVKMQSIKDEFIMQFFWVIDDLKPLYKHHIDEYIVFILAHQSEGSLSALLESQGFTSQTIAYKQHIVSHTIIGLQLTLTQPGTSEYLQVYELVMQYVSQLRPEQYIYNNMKSRSDIKWEFLEKIGSSSYSSKIASKLHYVGMENVLDHKTIFEPFDDKLIAKHLSSLNESNLLLFLSSSDPIPGSVAEPYLGGKYKVESLPKYDKVNIAKFNFLKPNKFLPISPKLEPQVHSSPQKLAPNVTLYKKNSVCKGGITLNVYSNVDKIFLQLYEHWSSMMLKQSTYDAQVLDSHMQFSSDRAIWINLFGYNEVVLKLVKIIGEEIHPILSKNNQKSEIFFEIVKDRMMQQYENYYLDETDDVLSCDLERILNAKTEFTVEQTLKTLNKMNMKQFAQKVNNFWKNVQLEWIIVGNFNEVQILQTIKAFQSTITNNPQVVRQEPCLKVTENFHYTIKIPSQEISTSGTLVYYEFDRNSFRNKLILDLLIIFMKEPFFDDLRTTKQLCYIAQTSSNLNSGIMGLKFLVVSSTADPSTLYHQMITFINKHFSELKNLSEQKLQEMKDAIFAKQCEPFKNLEQEYEFVVHQINGRTYDFNRKDKEYVHEQLNLIKLSDLQEATNKILSNHFSLEAVAKNHLKEYNTKTKSKKFDDLRKKGEYHPDYEHPGKNIV